MRYYCRLCGSLIPSGRKIKSHALTNATFFKPQKKIRPGSDIKIVSDTIKGESVGHYATEYAFCASCEAKFANWEQEREALLSNELARSSKSPAEEPYVILNGYDAMKISLACLADIFRCSVFEKEPYGKIILGEKHSLIISNILLNDNSSYHKISRNTMAF